MELEKVINEPYIYNMSPYFQGGENRAFSDFYYKNLEKMDS